MGRHILVKIIVASVALVLGTIGLGFFSLLDSVKEIDAAAYRGSLSVLQAIPGMVWISERVTSLGSIPANYGMAIGGGFIVWLQRRNAVVALLIVATLIATHALQKVTGMIVDGVIPVDDRIIGAAGPYFSGGVARVVVLAGILATAALPPSREADRLVWRLVMVLGFVEALTRLVLGRHWPIDLIASFPIGITIVWIFRRIVEWLPDPSKTMTENRTG